MLNGLRIVVEHFLLPKKSKTKKQKQFEKRFSGIPTEMRNGFKNRTQSRQRGRQKSHVYATVADSFIVMHELTIYFFLLQTDFSLRKFIIYRKIREWLLIIW